MAKLASRHWRGLLTLSLAVLLAGFLTIFKLWANNPSEAEPHGYPLIDNFNGTYKEPTSICR
ncbi:MAG: hypothetical protein WBQ20_05305 [Methyloceanibacter sp.]